MSIRVYIIIHLLKIDISTGGGLFDLNRSRLNPIVEGPSRYFVFFQNFFGFHTIYIENLEPPFLCFSTFIHIFPHFSEVFGYGFSVDRSFRGCLPKRRRSRLSGKIPFLGGVWTGLRFWLSRFRKVF